MFLQTKTLEAGKGFNLFHTVGNLVWMYNHVVDWPYFALFHTRMVSNGYTCLSILTVENIVPSC